MDTGENDWVVLILMQCRAVAGMVLADMACHGPYRLITTTQDVTDAVSIYSPAAHCYTAAPSTANISVAVASIYKSPGHPQPCPGKIPLPLNHLIRPAPGPAYKTGVHSINLQRCLCRLDSILAADRKRSHRRSCWKEFRSAHERVLPRHRLRHRIGAFIFDLSPTVATTSPPTRRGQRGRYRRAWPSHVPAGWL